MGPNISSEICPSKVTFFDYKNFFFFLFYIKKVKYRTSIVFISDEWESCSEKSDSDEDSDDDGWIDVHHSSDDEPQVCSNKTHVSNIYSALHKLSCMLKTGLITTTDSKSSRF